MHGGHYFDFNSIHLEVHCIPLKGDQAVLLRSSGAKPSYVNNASIPALQYHSPLLQSAWLNTNPVNLEVSANTPGKDYPLRSPISNAMSFPKDNHWNSQTFDWSTWWRAVRPLMWTMCSQRAGRGRAGPGLHEQLLTISSSMREMHTERDTPRHAHTHKHTLFSIRGRLSHTAKIKGQAALTWVLHVVSRHNHIYTYMHFMCSLYILL